MRLKLDKSMKKELMDWYADDHEDIKKAPQECFNMIVKQHCLTRGFITVRQFDEKTA